MLGLSEQKPGDVMGMKGFIILHTPSRRVFQRSRLRFALVLSALLTICYWNYGDRFGNAAFQVPTTIDEIDTDWSNGFELEPEWEWARNVSFVYTWVVSLIFQGVPRRLRLRLMIVRMGRSRNTESCERSGVVKVPSEGNEIATTTN
jgi:hypothetical protein